MTRSTQSRSLALRITAALLAAPIALSPILSTPAAAQWIVYDPTNYAQNVLTAARTLQQVNQQITQLQNEATMLINQARNLASLPYSSLQQLQQSVQRTQQLLQQAQGIAYDISARLVSMLPTTPAWTRMASCRPPTVFCQRSRACATSAWSEADMEALP